MLGIRAALTRRSGLHPAATSMLSTFEAISFLMAGLVLLSIALVLGAEIVGIHRSFLFLLSGIGLVFVALFHPRIWSTHVQNFFKKRGIELQQLDFKYSRFLRTFVLYFLVYVFWSFGLWALCPIVEPFDWHTASTLVFLLSFSWVSGFIVLIAPAGLGVRDAFLTLGISGYFSLPSAQALAIVTAFRLVATAVELFCALLGYAILKFSDSRGLAILQEESAVLNRRGKSDPAL